MRDTCLKYAVLGSFIILALSCHKNDGSNNIPKPYNLALFDSLNVPGYTSVTYRAEAINAGGYFDYIFYMDSTGTESLAAPTLPWSKTVILRPGALPSITANGKANKGGTISISYTLNGSTVKTSGSN